MQTWKQEVAEFDVKCGKKIDGDAKILALRLVMPETLFGEAGACSCRSSLGRQKMKPVAAGPVMKILQASAIGGQVEQEDMKITSRQMQNLRRGSAISKGVSTTAKTVPTKSRQTARGRSVDLGWARQGTEHGCKRRQGREQR